MVNQYRIVYSKLTRIVKDQKPIRDPITIRILSEMTNEGLDVTVKVDRAGSASHLSGPEEI